MKKNFHDINSNKYDSQLIHHLYELKTNGIESKNIDALIYLCSKKLSSLDGNKFPIEIQKVLDDDSDIDDCKNDEILARWREYQYYRYYKNRHLYLKKSALLYFEVFNKNSRYKYLRHAFELVINVRSAFKNEFDEIYNIGKNFILNSQITHQQNDILKSVALLMPEKIQIDFEDYIQDQIIQYCKNNDFRSAKYLIGSLKDIKVISPEEYKIRVACNLEKEGDHQNANKRPNTYYPNILNLYIEGLRMLKGFKCPEELKNRLEHKIKEEQLIYIKMMQLCSVSSPLDINLIDKILVEQKINCFNSGHNFIKEFPIIPKETIEGTVDKSQDKYFFSRLCNNSMRIDSKGKVAGISTMTEYNIDLLRSLYRSYTILTIKRIKWIMDLDKMIEKKTIYALISRCNSRFIPKDRIYLFVEGVYAGFNNDFITSAHILMPQIENSLKEIASQNTITVAKLAEKIQHDNTLGGVLDKIHHIMDDDLYEELKSFLVNTSGVNFRNELSHGIMDTTLIDYYGIYLWALCLKMILKTDDCFKFAEN